MSKFIKITSEVQIKELGALAKEIWNEHYIKILPQEQIDYMLDKFLSYDAINHQIHEGYEYYFIEYNGQNAGFLGFCLKEDYVFLSKLYVKSEFRGNKLGRAGIEFVENYALEKNIFKIVLTVNKYNMTSIFIYTNLGFNQSEAVVTDIGNGYFMDDYVMEKRLANAYS